MSLKRRSTHVTHASTRPPDPSPSPPSKRPRKHRPHTANFFHSLPPDLLDRLVSHLSLSDLHDLRLSGVGGTDATVYHQLRKLFRHRVRRLATLWHRMTLHNVHMTFPNFLPVGWPSSQACAIVLSLLGPGHHRVFLPRSTTPPPPSQTRPWPPRPTDIAELSSTLYLSHLDSVVATVIAEELPHLRKLELDCPRPFSSFLTSPWRPPHTLPLELGTCTQLTHIKLWTALNTFPESLLRLSNLADVEIADSYLSHLPHDIGLRLPHLRFFAMFSSPLKAIPKSLIDTVTRNRCDSTVSGIFVGIGDFPHGYWHTLLGREPPLPEGVGSESPEELRDNVVFRLT